MQPRVTIAMPAYNEERYIEACIASVQAQDYPRELVEILVADGRSTDRTRELLATMAAADPRIRVIDNPERLQAAGLNELVKQATGELILRMDVHCEYAADYVRRCVEVLERTGADSVGGAQRAKARTFFQRALAAALDSPLGVGGSKYRSAEQEGYVDTVFLGAFRRSVFETIGLWDPRAITNEDAELNQRILAAGGQIYLSRDVVVHYYPRDSVRSLATQYYKYGRGRARTLLKLGRLPRLSFAAIRPYIPFLMTASAALLAAIPPLWPVGAVAATGYTAAAGIEAVRVGAKAGARAVPVVWGLFPIIHVSHGVGVAVGLVHYLRHPDWTDEPERIRPRRAALHAV